MMRKLQHASTWITELAVLFIFFTHILAAGSGQEAPVFRWSPGEGSVFSTYLEYEPTPTVAPSKRPIHEIAEAISADPNWGLGVSGLDLTGKWLDPDGKNLPFQGYQEVEEFLKTADVISQKRIGQGVNNPLQVVLEKDGIRMRAVFRDVRIQKSRLELSDGSMKYNFRDEATFECAAYELAKLLGLDNLPPAVGRTISGKQGTLQAWVEEARTRKDLRKNNVEPPAAGLDGWKWRMRLQVIKLFDNLIYNEDRNLGNTLVDSDWKLWMIDHTRAFRQWKELPSPQTVRYCERDLWERLQKLDETIVRERLKDFLKPRELNGLLQRAAQLVEHIQGLIDEHGSGGILFTLR